MLTSIDIKFPSLFACFSASSQGSYRSWKTWKVMEFKNFIIQAWKVMEFNYQSLKVMEN